MSKVVGVHFVGHDSAIAVIDNEAKDVFGLSLERVTRVKHDARASIPLLQDYVGQANYAPYCFSYTDLSWQQVAYFDLEHQLDALKRRFDIKRPRMISALTRLLMVHPNEFARFFYLQFKQAFLNLSPNLEDFKARFAFRFGVREDNLYFFDHHLSHAASAYFTRPLSGFFDPLILTLDGQGDRAFSKVFLAPDGDLSLKASSGNAFSVPLLFSIATAVLGFTPAADEGKLEALAAYADETSDLSLSAALKGAFAVEKNFTISLHPTKSFPFTNISDQWVQVFKFLYEYRRRLGDMVFASNIQLFYEQFILSYISALQKETGKKSVVLAGGGFANVKLNRRIFESRIFENMYVVPAMGDDGAALGAALMLMKGVGGGELPLRWIREREMPYFGPVISPEEITDALRTWRGSLHAMYLHDAIHEFVSDDIVANRIVALVQGRMEFGPRALGNRSILANPRSSLMRDELNLRFKKREWFQPFCPSLLLTEAPKVFTSFYDNPHMTCAFSVRPNVQSELPAICHIDGTARPQMVTLKRNPLFFRILQQLQEKNKYGVCLNTSFNVHGKTIVCTASDAIDDFFACSIDVLYLGGWKITRLA